MSVWSTKTSRLEETFQLALHRCYSHILVIIDAFPAAEVLTGAFVCSGWVPVEKDNKQYCWHASVVDYDAAVALVLRPSAEEEDMLEIVTVPLAELMEQTLELIGTNVNGNPYGKCDGTFAIIVSVILIKQKPHPIILIPVTKQAQCP